MSNVNGSFANLILGARSVEDLLIVAMLASLRVTVAFALLPPMGETFLRGLSRQGIISIIAIYIAFGVPADVVKHIGFLELVGHAVKECLIGLAFGFAGSRVFWTAQSVGAAIDTSAGFNNVQLTNPLSGQQSTPVSDLLFNIVVALFFSLGGILIFLQAIFESFQAWPLLVISPSLKGIGEMFVINQTKSLMSNIVAFAAPVLIVLMLVDIGFGFVTRSASKLEISALVQPIKGAVTLLLLALMISTLVDQIKFSLLPTGLMTQLKSALAPP